jgi:hypothetical protein
MIPKARKHYPDPRSMLQTLSPENIIHTAPREYVSVEVVGEGSDGGTACMTMRNGRREW